MDKEKYLISILGEQTLDGETDKIEVLTAGNFMKKKDHFYIGYKEYDEDYELIDITDEEEFEKVVAEFDAIMESEE